VVANFDGTVFAFAGAVPVAPGAVDAQLMAALSVGLGDRDIDDSLVGLPCLEGGTGICARAAVVACSLGVVVAESRGLRGVCIGDARRW
jgi:hypothetical protein